MNKLIATIEQIDLFGVPVTVLTNEKQKSHKSFMGGIVSILAVSASLGYLFYILQQWITNQIPPTLNSKQKTNGYAEFSWENDLISLRLQDSSFNIDPFAPQNNIITPLLFTVVGKQILDNPLPFFSNPNSDSHTITISKGSLILNQYDTDSEHLDMKQYLLVFVTCQEQFLTKGNSCASGEKIQEYVENYNGLLFLTIKLNQFNYVNQTLDVFTKEYYSAFIPSQFSYAQIMLRQQHSIVDDGLLFKNQKDYYFISNYELINQQVNQLFIQNIISLMSNDTFKGNCLSSYLFRIDNISIEEEMVMPKLGQVLALVGSIVQLIFLIKYVALFYNGKKMQLQLYHDIVTMYYPDIKMHTKNNNILQRIVFQEQNSALEAKYKQLRKQAQQKCRLNNIIYEISRIQFILEQQFGCQTLTQSHQMGGKIIKNDCEEPLEGRESNRLVIKPVESFEFRQQSSIVDNIELLIKKT